MLSFIPVILFVVALYYYDNFKLVREYTLLACLVWGIFAAILSYYLNGWLIELTGFKTDFSTLYIAPLSEEILKAFLIIILASRRKTGFTIDAAIYGFASGAGFALAENFYHMINQDLQAGWMTGLLSSFAATIMHGACSSIMAILIINGFLRKNAGWRSFIPALIIPFLLHSLYNHFLFNPILQTPYIIIAFPVILALVYNKSTKNLQVWLEIEFSTEIEMLKMIRQGKFNNTKAGEYLRSLKEHFSPVIIVDLYNYISLHLELSIKAKRNILLSENGFNAIFEPDNREKLAEMKQLRKQIGKIGEMALQPIIRIHYRELWKYNLLDD